MHKSGCRGISKNGRWDLPVERCDGPQNDRLPSKVVWIASSNEAVVRRVETKCGATLKLPLASWWLIAAWRGLVV
jgi:hypothetical protein